jgi:DNA-binding HxlR family transcriptional regulator
LAPVSAKVLAQRLKELEWDGLISRVELVSVPPKSVEYRLTPLRESVRPVLQAIAEWERAVCTAQRTATKAAPSRDDSSQHEADVFVD